MNSNTLYIGMNFPEAAASMPEKYFMLRLARAMMVDGGGVSNVTFIWGTPFLAPAFTRGFPFRYY